MKQEVTGRRSGGHRRAGTVVVTVALLGLSGLGIATPALLPRGEASPAAFAGAGPSSADAVGHTPTTVGNTDDRRALHRGGIPVAAVSRPPAAPPSPAPTGTATSPGTGTGTAPSARTEQPRASRSASRAADLTLEREVVVLVNQRRADAGCAAVRPDSRLATAALGHSADMASRNYFSHTGRDGSSPWDRAKAAGYQNPTGENLARGQRTAAEVVTSWMNSPGHRANIVNCAAKAVGMGVARDETFGIYWTQLFGAA